MGPSGKLFKAPLGRLLSGIVSFFGWGAIMSFIGVEKRHSLHVAFFSIALKIENITPVKKLLFSFGERRGEKRKKINKKKENK